ncbi:MULTISPECIES: endonuclease V [unclassified Archaeoglobus]|jgi:deoxyribonuclease V|uniref:endonuclease V n=1 Tax=unclassified Archaeoglobus TaxID=2643606 RepID=UPI0025C1FE89|nr:MULTISPECIES: endonuclease V [unclassified Archaeoglobus]
MNLEKLKAIQEELARKVVLKDMYSLDEVKYVVGVDQAFLNDEVVSCAVKFTFPELKRVDEAVSVERVEFPYIPTFLMFREGEPAVKVVKKMVEERTIILVDGSGIAHPRRCGLATYIAISVGKPAVGITKKRLYGDVVEEGGLVKLKEGDKTIGYVLKTCKRCKPIYISPGSYISPETSLKIVQMCLKGYKLPEPVRAAHNLASAVKKSNLKA